MKITGKTTEFQHHDYTDESIRKQVIEAKMKQLSWLDKPKRYTVNEFGKVVPTGEKA